MVRLFTSTCIMFIVQPVHKIKKFPPPRPHFAIIFFYILQPICEVLDEYGQKYGTMFGVYLWRRPILVIADVEVLRNVMIKDYHKFYNKYVRENIFSIISLRYRELCTRLQQIYKRKILLSIILLRYRESQNYNVTINTFFMINIYFIAVSTAVELQ